MHVFLAGATVAMVLLALDLITAPRHQTENRAVNNPTPPPRG